MSCARPIFSSWTQSGNSAAAASSAPPTFDDKTAFGFLSDQLARERLRDFTLRSPEDYADSMRSRALFAKEWSAMLGFVRCVTSHQHHPTLDIRSC